MTKKHSFTKKLLLLLMTVTMLFTSCVTAFAEPISITAPHGVSEDETYYSIVFENGVLTVRVNPEKIYGIISDGNISREELLKFIPDDVLQTLSKGSSLTLDDITELVSNYITVDDLKELLNLVPTDIIRKYFSLEMIEGIFTVDEILSVIPVDDILNGVDNEQISALITPEILELLLNQSVKDMVITEAFVQSLIENSTIVDDVVSDPVIKDRLMDLLDDEMVESLINDPVIGANLKALADDPDVVANILADTEAVSAIVAYLTASENTGRLNSFLSDSDIALALIELQEIKERVVTVSVLTNLIGDGTTGALNKGNIRDIFTDAQLRSLITADTISAQLETGFLDSVFGDSDLNSRVFNDSLINDLISGGYFNGLIDPQQLVDDGVVTVEEIHSAFPDAMGPSDITAAQLIGSGLVSVSELRGYISNDDIKNIMQANPEARDQIVRSFEDNSTISDYWDYIDFPKFAESVSVESIKNIVESDETVYAKLVEKITPAVVLDAVGTETCRTIISENAILIINTVGIDSIFAHFDREGFVNAVGGYSALVTKGYVPEQKAVDAVGGYAALIRRFDINDVINAIGMETLLGYVNFQDVANAAGGYSGLISLYSVDELKEIFRAIGTDKIRAFLKDSGIADSVDVRKIASDFIELLRSKSTQIKALVKEVLNQCLAILLTEVDGIYINDGRIFENGSFSLNQIIVETLRAIPDIDSLLNLGTDDIFASYTVSVDFGGDVYTLGVEFGFLGDPTNLQNKLAEYADYFRLDVSDDLDIDLQLIVPGVASTIYTKVIESDRIPSELKEKLILLPSMTVEEARAFIENITDEQIEKIVGLISEKADEIKNTAISKVDSEIPATMSVRSSSISTSSAIDKAEAAIDKVLGYFLTVEKFNTLRNYLLKAIDKLPAQLSTVSVTDVYNGNGNFTMSGSASVDLYALISRYVTLPEDIRLLFDTLTISASADIDITLNDFYMVELTGVDGSVFKTMLPAGISLDVLEHADRIGSFTSSGWLDSKAVAAYSMPSSDVRLYSADMYYVQFVIEGNIIDTVFYTPGATSITEPAIPDEYVAAGYTRWEAYTLNSSQSIIVGAERTEPPVQYKVEFYADGVLVDTVWFNAGDTSVTEPTVPPKAGYTGVWEEYSLGNADIRVNAVYTPITYYVSFMADGTLVQRIPYTVETTSISEPDVPAKAGYTGVWQAYTLGTSDITVNAVYTPATYYVSFMADGTLVQKVSFTVESTSIQEPAVPAKKGYTGRWESYSITGVTQDITVNAEYSPNTYTVTFVADGNVVQTVNYRYGEAVTAPSVPAKTGYTGEWEAYDLSKAEDITVNAKYTAIKYNAVFTADGKVIATIQFTVEDTSINAPDVPAKTGYTGVWENYRLGTSDITVNAVYSPIIYTATFMADGKVVGTVQFTVEDVSINEPAVPAKAGYTGAWEKYTLGPSDITINAVYTEIGSATTDSSPRYENDFKWWILVLIMSVIIIILVVIIIVMKNKKDDNGTPGTPVAPADNPDDGNSEPDVPEEPVDEVVPEKPAEPEVPAEPDTDTAIAVPVEEPAEEPEEEKIDAVKADELMTDEDALAAVEVVSNSSAVASGLKAVINIKDINDNFKAGDTVTLDSLKEKKLVPAKAVRLKVLADGAINKAVTVEADSFSVQAIKMIKLTGGKVIQKK